MIWNALQQAWQGITTRRIGDLFDLESTRVENFTIQHDGLYFDYSKTNIDRPTKNLLLHLAGASNLGSYRDAMFAGQKINITENRPVLHTAERDGLNSTLLVDDTDIRQVRNAQQKACFDFAESVREGRVRPSRTYQFTDIVNIGIGGSDLGPRMVTRALSPYADGPRVHFVSNVDGAHLADTIADLNPATTLILIASKTFTTLETLTNARTARQWLISAIGETDVGNHLAAISNSLVKCKEFGIPKNRIFTFGEWIGGRYSIWSAIGLSAMIALGEKNFKLFLAGGKSIDDHFLSEPLAKNLPVMLALVGLWHWQICRYPTRIVMAYEQRLEHLAYYLQQLEMESNGKSVSIINEELPRQSGPVVWGGTGTNGQHAFFQHLHQGTQVTPCEFLVGACGHEDELRDHHDYLVANCFAQSEALMTGSPDDPSRLSDGKINRHRLFRGNRPSTTLVYKKLTPYVLGQIIALYEHRVFVEGVVLGINSFDQWGVELGKVLATQLYPHISCQQMEGSRFSPSLNGLLKQIHRFKG